MDNQFNKKANKWDIGAKIGFGLATPLAMDFAQHPENKTFGVDTVKDLVEGKMDRMRLINLALNGVLGGYGGGAMVRGDIGHAATAFGGIAAKDLALNFQSTPHKLNDALEEIPKATEAIPQTLDAVKEMQKSVQQVGQATAENSRNFNMLMGALGVGALGIGGAAALRYLTKKEKNEMGNIRLKLPGKKGDPSTEAEVNLPIALPDLSPAMIDGLNRGVKLTARKNIKANSFKRDPHTGKLIPYEQWEKMYGQQEQQGGMFDMFSKQASREWAEGAGTLTSSLVGGAAGAVAGKHLAESQGISGMTGGLVGGLLGVAAPIAGGLLAGKASGPRDPMSQEEHDSRSAFEEYVVPGNATYNYTRRKAKNQSTEPGMEMAPATTTPQYEHAAMDADAWGDGPSIEEEAEYDELGKMASAPPPPGPPPGPQGPPPPPGNVNERVPTNNPLPPAQQKSKMSASPTGASLEDISKKFIKATNNLKMSLDPNQAFSIEQLGAKADFSKSASAGLREVERIMERVYDENPSYWPHGLSVHGHESVYLVRDNMTKQAAGFVGWQQQRHDDGKLYGSYTVGILPEFRNQGLAKEAVAKLVKEKSRQVDKVVSYIMPDNTPSHRVAQNLSIPIIEEF